VAIKTSKQVVGDINKAAKEASRMQRMETEFQPNEQSIKDMVAREVQKEVSKLRAAKNKQTSRKPADAKRSSQQFQIYPQKRESSQIWSEPKQENATKETKPFKNEKSTNVS